MLSCLTEAWNQRTVQISKQKKDWLKSKTQLDIEWNKCTMKCGLQTKWKRDPFTYLVNFYNCLLHRHLRNLGVFNGSLLHCTGIAEKSWVRIPLKLPEFFRCPADTIVFVQMVLMDSSHARPMLARDNRELKNARFWDADGNRKCAVFPFNLSSHNHI